jgi:predicted nuclease of predicted toxin-antitoxin system
VRGLLRRNPNLEIARVQDLPIAGADDPTVLAWAAREGRILLTHDVNTITKYVYKRVAEGKSMPGVFEIKQSVAIGRG